MFIDIANANTQQTMPQFEATTLKANIKLIKGDSVYSQYGNVFVWGFVFLMGVGVFGLKFYTKKDYIP